MSIADKIVRLQNAKEDIADAIVTSGGVVNEGDGFEEFPADINTIKTYKSELIDLIERDITTISLPTGTTKIGGLAFYGCGDLASVTIPNSVLTIGKQAFMSSGLTNVTIPDSVVSLEASIFNSCTSLQSVQLSKNCPIISASMFYGCNNLLNIYIPSGVTEIKDDAFRNCANLANIYVPKSVTKIGRVAFGVPTTGLPRKTVWYEGTAEEWASITIESGAFPSNTLYQYESYTPTA